jgi:hypothetical protein
MNTHAALDATSLLDISSSASRKGSHSVVTSGMNFANPYNSGDCIIHGVWR